MLITYHTARNRFEAISTYEERHTANPLLKSTGFAFDGNVKCWHSAGYRQPLPFKQQITIAARLWDYCNDQAKDKMAGYGNEVVEGRNHEQVMEALVTKANQDVQASRATDSEVQIPKPDGLEYLPYQRAGIAYAMARPHALIADEMGLGKTIQGIGISNTDPKVRRVLIIAPASMKLTWRREWTKWDVKGLTVGVAYSNQEFPQTDVVIVNFDIVKKLHGELLKTTWDLMLVDECHKVKNPDALRTKHILGAPAGKKLNKDTKKMEPTAAIPEVPARRRVFLTGTPILNRPVELWTLVHKLDPQGLGKSFFGFALRYCAAVQNKFGWDFSGASNLDELQERLRGTFMVRRLKSEVLKDLPAKRRQVVLIEPDRKGRALIEKEKVAYENFRANEGDSVMLAEMSRMRKEVAVYKAPFVVEHVKDLLETQDKVIVMAHHKEVVDILMAEFGAEAVKVDGRVTKMEDRQTAVDRFQTDPKVKVFVGSILAAGVGLTLTASSLVVFAELDWVPGNVSQAEDRAHRIGQRNQVLVQHIILDESLDANMINKIIDKQQVIDKALDTKPEPKPEAPKAENPAVGVKAKPVATDGTSEVEIKGKKITLTLANIEAIHTGIKTLRARCDGAIDRDGAGFSGADKDFGWSLAAAPRLSPRQAGYGQNLIRKYQGQLPEALVLAAGVVPKGGIDV